MEARYAIRKHQLLAECGYPLKAGHLMTSSTERHGLLSFPRPGQVIDLR
jgi:hypothetical protein